MFSIEHDFDATVVTLVDEATGALREDVIIRTYEDRVVIEQFDPGTNKAHTVTLSMAQLRDLAAALDLPEGLYRLSPTVGAQG